MNRKKNNCVYTSFNIPNAARAYGFTILEIGITTFLTITIVIITGLFIYKTLNATTFTFDENQAITQAQYSLTRMLTDIREARIAETGAWPVELAEDNALTIYSDVTNDKKPDRVRYFIENSMLKKGVTEPSGTPASYPLDQEKITTITTLLDNGTHPLFTYYDGNWPKNVLNNPIPAADRLLNTRYISVYIRIKPSNNATTAPLLLQSGVSIRSLKDNL